MALRTFEYNGKMFRQYWIGNQSFGIFKFVSLENTPIEQDYFMKVRMLSVMIENVKYGKFSA